ncbi:MAG: putative lipid II flippase FtsW [Patescibacteria group bacterium]|nr:MAG: putative lipid II flippase FtsW [Patescibacteria group bacterium]
MLKKLLRITQKFLWPAKHQADRGLVVTTIILVVFGLIMLASASVIAGFQAHGDGYYYFKNQLPWAIIGLLLFFALLNLDYHKLEKWALFLMLPTFVLLLLVFVPGIGKEVNGSKAWISIFGYSLQPAEFAKITFLIYLAALFKNAEVAAKKFWSFFTIFAAVALLILLQPDPGTLIILTATSFVVYLIGGGRLKYFLGALGIALLGLVMLITLPMLFNKNESGPAKGAYRIERIRCFMDHGYAPEGACYQVNQSVIAVGSGGILGRGLGESRQKFLYIPEVQNDFIFAIIAEEVGFVFSLILLILFAWLFYRGYKIAQNASDNFGKTLAFGIVFWLAFQTIVNIGGIMRILPLTGVPLPLISAGGSALVASLVALGILASISRFGKNSTNGRANSFIMNHKNKTDR